MIRVVIENLVLFLAPTLIYLAYGWLRRDDATSGAQLVAEAPYAWLAAIGSAVVLVTLVLFGSTSGGRPDQGYEPPEMKNGKVIPGHQQQNNQQ